MTWSRSAPGRTSTRSLTTAFSSGLRPRRCDVESAAQEGYGLEARYFGRFGRTRATVGGSLSRVDVDEVNSSVGDCHAAIARLGAGRRVHPPTPSSTRAPSPMSPPRSSTGSRRPSASRSSDFEQSGFSASQIGPKVGLRVRADREPRAPRGLRRDAQAPADPRPDRRAHDHCRLRPVLRRHQRSCGRARGRRRRRPAPAEPLDRGSGGAALDRHARHGVRRRATPDRHRGDARDHHRRLCQRDPRRPLGAGARGAT